MYCSKWVVVCNVSGSQSCCVLGRDCTKVRCSKKNSLLHDNELMHLITEIGSCQIFRGGWLECRFM